LAVKGIETDDIETRWSELEQAAEASTTQEKVNDAAQSVTCWDRRHTTAEPT
jgi:hypothetical protein